MNDQHQYLHCPVQCSTCEPEQSPCPCCSLQSHAVNVLEETGIPRDFWFRDWPDVVEDPTARDAIYELAQHPEQIDAGIAPLLHGGVGRGKTLLVSLLARHYVLATSEFNGWTNLSRRKV